MCPLREAGVRVASASGQAVPIDPAVHVDKAEAEVSADLAGGDVEWAVVVVDPCGRDAQVLGQFGDAHPSGVLQRVISSVCGGGPLQGLPILHYQSGSVKAG